MAKQNLYGSKDSVEAKKMMEEISKLRSLNKHRDEIIGQMESQNKNLRETETQLKLTQNDYELLHTQNKALELRVKDLQEKCEGAEARLAQLREKALHAEKDKEQQAIEYQNKIELLQYKLLNKVENDSSFGDDSGGGSSSGSKQFQELLSLCKSDLEEILNRLKSQVQSEAAEE
jgi:predicted RNase H-like nuclease (RuvC/YqgF family)